MTLNPMSSGSNQFTRHKELVTASALKLRIARIVTSDKAGQLIGAFTRKRIRHQGLWFDTRSSDFSPSVRAQMFWGVYEAAEARMIRTFLRGSSAVVELGGSLGVTTAHIAAVMASGGHLISVEANPRLLPGLRHRIMQRSASIRVDVVHGAITDHCGTTMLAVAAETVGSRIGSPQPHETTIRIPAMTLREVLSKMEAAEFDLVSDIEGAEVAFLLQDPDVLTRCRRAVIELHGTTLNGDKVSVFDLIDAASRAGLQVISRHGPVVALIRS